VPNALRAWRAIHEALAKSRRIILLLDFDGTLVRLRRLPTDVTVPQKTRDLLLGLSRNKRLFVAIVSGRRVADLQRLIQVRGLRYYGVHGVERGGRKMPIDSRTRVQLRAVRRSVLRDLSRLPGIMIEDKGLGFAVHYREATTATARRAGARLLEMISSMNALHILKGKRIWEVLPRSVTGKSVALSHIFGVRPKSATVIYIGDDAADEEAFQALPGAITIRVGARRRTNAAYYLSSPAEVLHFLGKLQAQFATPRQT